MPHSRTALPDHLRRTVPGSGPAVWCAVLWTLLVAVHFALRGQWFWFAVNLLPPLLFLLPPAALLAEGLRTAVTASTSRGLALVAATLPSLLAGAHLAGVYTPDALSQPSAPLRVLSWNTEFWEQTDDPAAFYAYLRGFEADVYLLQEYAYTPGEGIIGSVDKSADLARFFPGYAVVQKNEQLTLSRVPVVAVPPVPANNVLRVDLAGRDGRPVSTYNVHIPVPYKFQYGLSARFVRQVKEINVERSTQLAALAQDTRANPFPLVTAGDFNASPISGELATLRSHFTDVAAAEDGLFVAGTWGVLGLRLWRVDWVLASSGAVANYRAHDPGPLSDHSALSFELSAG